MRPAQRVLSTVGGAQAPPAQKERTVVGKPVSDSQPGGGARPRSPEPRVRGRDACVTGPRAHGEHSQPEHKATTASHVLHAQASAVVAHGREREKGKRQGKATRIVWETPQHEGSGSEARPARPGTWRRSTRAPRQTQRTVVDKPNGDSPPVGVARPRSPEPPGAWKGKR